MYLLNLVYMFQNCNDFLAGNLLRSKSRFAALDETGVIGIACRHEYPLCLYNLRHGERYYYMYIIMHETLLKNIIRIRISYIVYALEMLKQRYPDQSRVFLLYDVACVLKRHLKVCIPHAYIHGIIYVVYYRVKREQIY